MLMIAVLSAPVAVAAEDAPKTDDTAKTTDKPKTEKTKEAKLSSKELQVIASYHMDNKMQVELGNHVMKNGSRAEVKSYGEMLAKEHEGFDDKLAALAKKTGQMIPTKMKPATAAEKEQHANMKKTAANIKNLKGEDLDREYLRFMIEDHDKMLSNIDTHISDAKHPELADALREVKPTLQRHADKARELQKSEAQAMK